MANKIKKISINAFEEAVNAQYEPVHSVEWNGLSIVVKHNLTLHDMLAFVDTVVRNSFSNKDASYMPEIKDFATRDAIIEYYTNISLPSNVEKRYDLLYRSAVLDAIMPVIDQLQFNAMMRAIEEKTAHLAQANIEATTKQMNELFASFENMQKQLSDMFGDVNKETISGAMEAFLGGSFDEEKIVNAVLKAQEKKEA